MSETTELDYSYSDVKNTNSLSDILELDFVNSNKELLDIESQIQSDVTADTEIPKEVNNDTFENGLFNWFYPLKMHDL